MDSINFIKAYVEGSVSPADLEQAVFNDVELQKTLEDDSLDWSGTYIDTNPYDYLCINNITSISGRMNAQGVLQLFLDKKGKEYNSFAKYANDYELVLDCQPKYIDADVGFIEKHILNVDGSKSKAQIKKEIKNRFRDLFQSQKKPPRWIQSPQWPIVDEKPLFFMGQIVIKDCQFYHDDGEMYIFINPEHMEEVVIKQFY